MTVSISVWSDIACPWCYIGKRRLEAALKEYEEKAGAQAHEIELSWRSFELDPRAKDPKDKTPYRDRLAKKYGTSTAQAQEMLDRMTNTGAAEGIAFDFDNAVPANTFNAHRLLQWAARTDFKKKTKNAQNRLKEQLVQAHLEQGVDLGDTSALLSVVDQAELDVDEAAAVLESNDFADDVRGDEEEAQMHGVTGVPFFAIGRFGVAGAQPVETLLEVIEKAVSEQIQAEKEEAAIAAAEADLDEDALCGLDGC